MPKSKKVYHPPPLKWNTGKMQYEPDTKKIATNQTSPDTGIKVQNKTMMVILGSIVIVLIIVWAML